MLVYNTQAGRVAACVASLLYLAVLSGCSKDEPSETAETSEPAKTSKQQARYITVQHILIGFEGSVPGKPITRSSEDAEALAEEVFKKAKSGSDFDALVKEYTDDAHPGIYKMANFGVPADRAQRVFAREQMVGAFGNVGFNLEVGEVGLAEHDPATSKYGWHIIKRIE
jgi:hypothetical protein